MIRKLLTCLSVSLITVILSFTAQVAANGHLPGETHLPDGSVMIPVGRQSHHIRQTLHLPEHGQTMAMVKEMLGSPGTTDAIGEPVITRWHYPERNMTIYFESNRVLRSVINNSLQP